MTSKYKSIKLALNTLLPLRWSLITSMCVLLQH